jgi:hypothetical protein
MKTSGICPSLADETAGLEGWFVVVVKIIEDGHDHFLR